CSASNPRASQEDLIDLMKIRFDSKGIGKMVVRRQNYTSMLNSLVLCIFSQAGYAQYYTPADFPGISANDLVEWFKYATGREIGLEEFLKTGERIFNLKHLINLNRGITSKDDTLSERLLKEKRGGSSPAGENLPSLESMLDEYYAARGWDKDGKIRKEKLEELVCCL
ncbi:MAG TPA: aldehyde ferredoxin oxidoreductase C-terminal domain-containing protein, partial [Thermodesulfovibrionales bacterium]|nr:aldehyde ferredoxin oxidoreductase C-terminal domain-containing protein [Thermodesulfovibrionales bacterium]